MPLCPQCGNDCKPTGGWQSSGFICKHCNRVLLPSKAYEGVVAVVSLLPAIGFVLFVFAAGYPEVIFTSVVFVAAWLVSYQIISFLGHRLLPPRLVLRHSDKFVTLDLSKEDKLRISTKR